MRVKLSFLILIAWLWAGMAGGALAPQVTISLRPNNYVDSPTGVVSTAGTTTSGIQEAINSVQRSTNLFVGPAGGGMINQGAGMYNYSSQITMPNTALRPFNITFQGAGWLNTIWRHIGTTAFDGIVSSYNPSFGSTNTLTVTFNDIGFTVSSNFVMYIMNLGGVSYAHFNRCMFAPDAALTYNPAGWTANIHENGLTNVQGVAAVKLQSAQNPGVFFNECIFLGLASGVYNAVDNCQLTRCIAVDIGGYYNGSSFVFTNLWTTGPESLGAVVIDNSSSGDLYITDGQFGNVAAALACISASAGLEGHKPTIKGGYFGDNGHTVLTYDKRPVVLESVFEGAVGADSVLTNTSAGVPVVANIVPNNVYRKGFANGGTPALQIGTNGITGTVYGDLTNALRFSSLGGSAVFDATVTTTTNYFVISGWSANSIVLNGKYYPTNCPASVCADSGSLLWTNIATGAYLLYDPVEGCITDDDWEWHNSAGALLGAGTPFGTTISANPDGPSNGGSGTGSGNNPSALFVSTSTTLSSPKAVLPQVVATNGFIGNGAGLTNIPSSEVGVTDASSATVGNVGQVISSLRAVGSATGLSSGVASNVVSISLTAGDWDVMGNINFVGSTATASILEGGINTTSLTLPSDGSEVFSGVTALGSGTDSVTVPRKVVNVSSTTIVYLVGKTTFSVGTVAVYGSITARRVR